MVCACEKSCGIDTHSPFSEIGAGGPNLQIIVFIPRTRISDPVSIRVVAIMGNHFIFLF